jgi:hypothetical protein
MCPENIPQGCLEARTSMDAAGRTKKRNQVHRKIINVRKLIGFKFATSLQ